jgi:hypothetical protein
MACINAMRAGACAALISAATALQAQNPNIERAPLGNNDLCCAQVRRETAAMDRAIEEARMQESQGNTTQTAGAAGSVATEVISRAGGFGGALGGITGHGVGKVAGRTASTVAQQAVQPTVAQAQGRMRRTSTRREPIAGLFLREACRADDRTRNPLRPANTQTVDAAPAIGAAPVQIATASPMQRIAAQTSDERQPAAAVDVVDQATGTLARWLQQHPTR